MSHRRFNPEHLHKLDNAERREKLPPEKLLKALPLELHHTVMDLGAGTGYFTLPIARRVRRVLAVDVAPEMLQELERRIQNADITNVDLIQAEIEDLSLGEEVVNHVVASLVLHEVEPLSAGLSQIYHVLKPGGYLFCLEWSKVESQEGPPLWHRISLSSMEEAFEKAGLEVVYHEHPTHSHYLLIGRKR